MPVLVPDPRRPVHQGAARPADDPARRLNRLRPGPLRDMLRAPVPALVPALLLMVSAAALQPARAADPEPAADDPARYVQFVEEDADKCVSRNGVQIQVKSTHPTRRIRIWMDRTLGGNGTGDRSRSDLAPGADPEPLGCSRNGGVVQGWRLVRAVYID